MFKPAPQRDLAVAFDTGLTGPALTIAKVTYGTNEGSLELEIGDRVVRARISFGCLVRPVAGDRVLVVETPGEAFVLSVLERLVPDSATLALPTGGALAVEGDELRLVARKAVSIDAPRTDIRGRAVTIVADSLNILGRMSNWVAEHLRVSARTQETAADTVSVKALDRVAIIERSDVLRANNVAQTIDGVAVTSAPAVVIATTEDLRLDGKRVTVG